MVLCLCACLYIFSIPISVYFILFYFILQALCKMFNTCLTLTDNTLLRQTILKSILKFFFFNVTFYNVFARNNVKDET